jgi:hypothetical protein
MHLILGINHTSLQFSLVNSIFQVFSVQTFIVVYWTVKISESNAMQSLQLEMKTKSTECTSAWYSYFSTGASFLVAVASHLTLITLPFDWLTSLWTNPDVLPEIALTDLSELLWLGAGANDDCLPKRLPLDFTTAPAHCSQGRSSNNPQCQPQWTHYISQTS